MAMHKTQLQDNYWLEDRLWDQLNSQFNILIRDQFRDQLWGQFSFQLRNHLWSQLRESIRYEQQ